MSNLQKAALWMMGAIVSFSLMAIAGRAVSTSYTTFEIMFYRSLLGVGVVIIALSYLKKWPELKTQQIGLHFLRNSAHFVGQNLWFFALPLIPLAQLFALEFTTPIWVMLLAILFLGESLSLRKAVVTILGFIGVYIVANPNFNTLNTGVLAGILASVCFGVSVICTQKLTQKDTIACVLFYLALMQLVFGAVIAGYDGVIAPLSWQNLPWMGVIALCGLTAHLCLTKAVTLAPASQVTPVDYLRLPLIIVIGVVFYGEGLNIWILLGAGIILVANYINLVKSAS